MSILAALTMEKLIHMVFCWKMFSWNWKLLYAKKNQWEKVFMRQWVFWKLCGLDKGTPSEDNIKFNLRYSEGFPCFIDPGNNRGYWGWDEVHIILSFPTALQRTMKGLTVTFFFFLHTLWYSWEWGSWDPHGFSRKHLLSWKTIKLSLKIILEYLKSYSKIVLIWQK